VQLQFVRGTSLDPVPPKASKHDEVRYLDIHEDDELDENQLRSWIEQASNPPGGRCDAAMEPQHDQLCSTDLTGTGRDTAALASASLRAVL
jgi:hypothetical protein